MVYSHEPKNNLFMQTSHDRPKLRDTTSVAALGHSSSGSFSPSGTANSTLQGVGSALNVETLVTTAECQEIQIETPSSEVQDKIISIINNKALATLETKAEEFAALLQEPYYLWFAQYLVIKRASTEPNSHDLYTNFLECLNLNDLYKAIVKATYEKCKVLLKLERIKSTSEERLLLENMGSWVGKLTIGRNKMLLASEIDPKSLITEAHEKGLLTALIPFVCKILVTCQSSFAYRYPNPWATAILKLLAHIHSTPGLNSNTKFEIEVLFRNLEIDMRDITPATILKDHKLELVGNLDSSDNIRDTTPQALNQGHTPDDVAGHMQEDPSQSSIAVNEIATRIPVMRHYPLINLQLSALGMDIYSQRLVPAIVDMVIRAITTVMSRWSRKVAMRRMNELLLKKNYHPCSDETIFYHHAHMLVRHAMMENLAGCYPYIKETFCGSLAWHVRNLLVCVNMQSENRGQAVQIVTNYFLGFGAHHIRHEAFMKEICSRAVNSKNGL